MGFVDFWLGYTRRLEVVTSRRMVKFVLSSAAEEMKPLLKYLHHLMVDISML